MESLPLVFFRLEHEQTFRVTEQISRCNSYIGGACCVNHRLRHHLSHVGQLVEGTEGLSPTIRRTIRLGNRDFTYRT